MKKLLAFILIAAMFCGSLSLLKVDAAERKVATPTFKLKLINEGTGVKITINKTKGATTYYIFMTKRTNAYSKYLYKNGECYTIIGSTDAKKNKKSTFVINGLPKGKYSFEVMACYEDSSNWEYVYSEHSKTKSIKVKAAPKTEKKNEQSYDFSSARKDDIVRFGSYEQDGNMLNGKEPIEWIVMYKDKNSLTLMSKDVLDCVPYNTVANDDYYNPIGTTWENCTLREWLNDVFYKNAFTKNERSLINTQTLENNSSQYGIGGGRSTKDKVYVPSINDMKKWGYELAVDSYDYYPSAVYNSSSTPYADIQGCLIYPTSEGQYFCERYTTYWLRTPGSAINEAATVDTSYGFMPWGDMVDSDFVGVRPVINIKLSDGSDSSSKKTDTSKALDEYGDFVMNKEFLYSGDTDLGYDDIDGGYTGVSVGLYDMNGDSIPELIINNGYNGRDLRANYFFTYKDGKIVYCGSGSPDGYVVEDYPGIFLGVTLTGWYLDTDDYSDYAEVDILNYFTLKGTEIIKEKVYEKGYRIDSYSMENIYITGKKELLAASERKRIDYARMNWNDLVKNGWYSLVEKYSAGA